ncbi:MAG: insulinase family protein [Ignavibacteriaceae bacterium]|nr:insulinase family protein [Ignavibacteriaceae bacterium]
MYRLFLYLLIIQVMLMSQDALAQKAKDFDIPYKKFTLKNGLTLIVHEDSKAPVVAVNIWYHVGSKNEKKEKTGFAHLFEHLMFNGSENFDDDYFQALERVGATDLNGTTNNDRTNYFQTVPVSALDQILFLESDRMGHLLGAVTQEKLDEQRGVVQNEKRQGENQPYAVTEELITQNTYPAGHPYSWTVIGSMEDLDAAKLEDVHEWFKTYYGAANAVVVVAGAVQADDVLKRVEKYFGDIPSGPPIAKHQVWVAKMTGTKRQTVQDRVPQARIYKVWNLPEWGTKDLTLLDMASDILSSGKTSRFYKRLVYDEQIATSVNAFYAPGEIGSQFYIVATAKPGVDLKKVEQVLDDEFNKFLKEGPTAKEMERVKTQIFASFVRGVERVGGFGGKSDILAENEVYGDTPDYYKTRLGWVESATAAEIKKAANEWLSDGVYILEVHPFPEYQTTASDVDRKKLPENGTPPDAVFPAFEKAELSNGLKIVLSRRSSIPVVNMTFMFDAGYAADMFTHAGTASLAMNMLDEGTKTKNALQISEELDMLGAQLSTGAGLDYATVRLNALKMNLDKSLDLLTDVMLNPSFPEKDLERLRNERLATIAREKNTPTQMGYRVFAKLLFGEGHAYGNPLTGSGFETSVKKITRDDIVKYYDTWLRPNNATLIVTGDITMDELKPKLEKALKNWKQGTPPKKNVSEVKIPEKPVIYIVDRPGSQQSIIFAGHVSPSRGEDEIAVEAMNNVLGGTFTSRINMNLREDKHWSYGAGAFIINTKYQRPYLFYGMVQSDKTKESLLEIYKEAKEYISTRPVTADELDKVKLNQTLALPGSWETIGAVSGSLTELVMYNLPDNFFATYSDKVKNLSEKDVKETAAKYIKPDNFVWVVVGDRAKIEPALKETGYEIQYMDSDGNVVK